ncbi:Nif11-like leader peptide family RiPP precursor [Synechococcus lacustris]|uniref:Nif11-like leader peptide family RiPP precursor n=1 Tax=Synechococcus lacustris TaxID=2116544 RepID=UPI0020CDEF25|nr:Nif11-like leader peptide family RiPP precursor [Synechococcus lacustris]MCP9815002.1 Nif11-like leader peptide family RiPP precursor [Synechococcus lacustris L1E-Slac]
MSDAIIQALAAKLKDDPGLQKKINGAVELDDYLMIAKEAGFEISKAEFMRYKAKLALELSDEDLENVAGGGSGQGCFFLTSIGG